MHFIISMISTQFSDTSGVKSLGEQKSKKSFTTHLSVHSENKNSVKKTTKLKSITKKKK